MSGAGKSASKRGGKAGVSPKSNAVWIFGGLILLAAAAVFVAISGGPPPKEVPPSTGTPASRSKVSSPHSRPKHRRRPQPDYFPDWNATDPLPFVDLYSDLYTCSGGYQCAKPNPRNHMATRRGESNFCDFDVLQPGDLTFERFDKEYRNKRPFLLNTTASDWTKPKLYTHRFFSNNFGSMPTDVGGSLDIVRYSGKGYMEMPTGEFMGHFMTPAQQRKWASEPLYTFTRISGASPEDAPSTGMHWVSSVVSVRTHARSLIYSPTGQPISATCV